MFCVTFSANGVPAAAIAVPVVLIVILIAIALVIILVCFISRRKEEIVPSVFQNKKKEPVYEVPIKIDGVEEIYRQESDYTLTPSMVEKNGHGPDGELHLHEKATDQEAVVYL